MREVEIFQASHRRMGFRECGIINGGQALVSRDYVVPDSSSSWGLTYWRIVWTTSQIRSVLLPPS